MTIEHERKCLNRDTINRRQNLITILGFVVVVTLVVIINLVIKGVI